MMNMSRGRSRTAPAHLLIICLSLLLAPDEQPGSSVDVTFQSGDVTLAGSLTIPPGAGRKPAVVLIGGSGPSSVSMMKPFTDHLSGLGLVTLVYDKRGSGRSTGSWTTASLEDLADDAEAAMRLVAARPDVDPARVGVWAVSQGGWVVSSLARRSKPPAFAIVVTGGGTTPREVELYGHRNQLERAGATRAEREEAEALLARYFDWLGTGEGRPALDRAIEEARGKSWYKVLSLDRVLPSERNRTNWAWVAAYDPVPDIARMRMPVLIVLGELDQQAAAGPAAAAWREGLERAGNRSFEIIVIPGMGHAALEGGIHKPGGPRSARYFSTVETWVRAVLLEKPGGGLELAGYRACSRATHGVGSRTRGHG